MNLIDQCPICGSPLAHETVEKLLRGGNNIAALRVQAGVCKKCGEIVFDAPTHQRFERVRHQLEQEQLDEFTLIGRAFAA